jgi:peroxiredoxin Q/BCP
MVSLDPPERNREFAESLGAGFPVLSDPDGKAARAYGVLAPGGGVARRWTFFIDERGMIRRIDKQVSPATHGPNVVRTLEELGLTRPDRDPRPLLAPER